MSTLGSLYNHAFLHAHSLGSPGRFPGLPKADFHGTVETGSCEIQHALIPCCAGILEKSFMFQNLSHQRFHRVGNSGLWAHCERSLSGAFCCLSVSALQCNQQELHEMVIRFLTNDWGWGKVRKKTRYSWVLVELFYTQIVTFGLLLLTSKCMLWTEPIKLGIFQVAEYSFQLMSALHDFPLLMLLVFWRQV